MLKETIKTYDKIAEKYAKKHWHTALLSDEKNEFIKKCRGEKVLDAGCGPGIYTRFLLSRGFKVTSIDLSVGMLKEAKKRVPKGRFYPMSVTKLKFPARRFDGVFCSAVLLHLNDDEANRAIKEFYRVLKPGGLLFISTKMGRKQTVKVYPDGTKRFIHFYMFKFLKDSLEKAGFEVEESHKNMKDTDGDVWLCIFARKHDINPTNNQKPAD